MSESIDLDRCVRAMTNDGGFRLIAVTLKDTIAGAIEAQHIEAEGSEKLAELMVSAVLLRETTSPGRRVQLALRDRSGGRLVADSLADGLTRGLVRPGNGESLSESPWDRSMEVTYTQSNGALHKGIVAIADETDISAAMMTYLQESEQILTTISVAASSPTAANAVGAAGFVVQLLPELERAQLAAMTERLAGLETLATQMSNGLPSTDDMIDQIFDGFEYTILADSKIQFGCNCSRERFLAGIGTLGEDEIKSMIDAGEPLELRCEACGKGYEIAVEELEEL